MFVHRSTEALRLTVFSLLCFWATSSVTHCFTFYSADLFNGTSAACPDACRYRTTCDKDTKRSTCIRNKYDCAKLLPRGQLIAGWINRSDGIAILNYTCQSCMLNGCRECKAGANGSVACNVCDGHFELDGKGGCKWKERYWSYAFYVVICLFGMLVLWILIDVIWAEWSQNTNEPALLRGLVMRKRAKLLQKIPISDDTGHTHYALGIPPLTLNLFRPSNSSVSGPGLTLFMNWYIFVFILALWLFFCALFLGPSAGDESAEYVQPCRQQRMVSRADGREEMELVHPGGDTPFRNWTIANYFGSLVLTMAFFLYQEYLWNAMVMDWKRPALQEYCVQLSNMPSDLTNKSKVRQLLGDWMAHLHLDPHGIRHISIAYDIPEKMRADIDNCIETHIKKTADHHSKKHVRHACGLDISAERTADAGPFWIQVIAGILLGTPFDLSCRRRNSAGVVAPEDDTGGGAGGAVDLSSLKGSGFMYVLMDTEALALAIAGMGIARLPEIDCTNIRIRKSPLGPESVRWYDHAPLTWSLYRKQIYLVFKALAIFLVVLILWLMFFAWYLTFEIVTMGLTTYSKTFLSMFVVGLLVPIGNALFGAIIEMQTEAIGFRSEERMRFWRLFLNTVINAVANFGEIYLVHEKVYDAAGWKITDVPWEFSETFQQAGINPHLEQFHTEIMAILWPAGLLVPIFIIPVVETFLPLFVGRLRLKRDCRLTPADAERILKPIPVDIISTYSDALINITLVSITFWISPGRYHIVLWGAVALWSVLQGMVSQMNILRWQARCYFGGNEIHRFTALLLAFPLGIMAAAMECAAAPDHTGWLGFGLHISMHIICMLYLLPKLHPTHVSLGTRYDEMMKDEDHAPIVNYRNTNPIEVLKVAHAFDSEGKLRQDSGLLDIDQEPLVFYRHDKWYLQETAEGHNSLPMIGEEGIEDEGRSLIGFFRRALFSIKRDASSGVFGVQKAVSDTSHTTPGSAGSDDRPHTGDSIQILHAGRVDDMG